MAITPDYIRIGGTDHRFYQPVVTTGTNPTLWKPSTINTSYTITITYREDGSWFTDEASFEDDPEISLTIDGMDGIL